MIEEERIARELQSRLGRDAQLVGAGVHWGVEIARAPRACAISCFWYGEDAGLMLGMNPSNARTALGPTYRARSGAEYLVRFHDAELRIAGGRTHDVDAAIGAVREWLEGKSIAHVAESWPFVDATRRRMHELLAIVTPSCGDVARCVIDCNIGFELWIHGRGRSCQLHAAEDGTVSASFLLGPAQVAFGDVTADPATPISRWVHGATLAELTRLGITSEPRADLLESGDVARWHWLHVRERIAHPNDVLAGSRPLLERLAERELPTRFFSYSSLSQFCFSASSHFPWVNDGLPVIIPPYQERGYVIDVGTSCTECDLPRAIEVIESALATYPIAPFFGSAAYLTIGKLDAELARAGSALRAELRQHCQWYYAAVVSGERHCTVSGDLRSAVFHEDGEQSLRASFGRASNTVDAIRKWLEDRWSIDELRLLPSASDVSIDSHGFDPD
jgi:hypothetical protein